MINENIELQTLDQKLISHKPGFGSHNSIEVRSTGFTAGEWLPRKFTQEADNVSPNVVWSNVPENTKELVLICEDPHAPIPEPFVHWIIYGISPKVHAFQEDIRVDSRPEVLQGAKQGKNSKGVNAYIGPFPPIASGPHYYYFQMFALDTELNLAEGCEREEVVRKMEGHVIAQGTFIGIYERFGTLG